MDGANWLICPIHDSYLTGQYIVNASPFAQAVKHTGIHKAVKITSSGLARNAYEPLIRQIDNATRSLYVRDGLHLAVAQPQRLKERKVKRSRQIRRTN